MTEQDISRRNGLLIDIIGALNMGIRIINLPHQPRLVNDDYTIQYCAYVSNFDIVLLKGKSGDPYKEKIALKKLSSMDIMQIKQDFAFWTLGFEHDKIYTIKLAATGLYVCGFNHKNKILKKNPYPVFSKFDPLTYYDLQQAEAVINNFTEFDLIINKI